MNQISTLHHQAMDLAEAAEVAKLRGEFPQFNQLLRQALKKEAEAASLISDDLSAEPTRSILHRSAASLAIECGEFDQAKQLIANGLTGNPPKEIAEELKDLLIQTASLPLQESSLLVSLSQLRQWYAIARSLGHTDRLHHIAELGTQFKQLYKDTPPDEARQFSIWSEQDESFWLADLAAYSKLSKPSTPSSETHFDQSIKVEVESVK